MSKLSVNSRRCCHKGCEASISVTELPADWYKCSYGFMSWACPEHAEQWRQFDQRNSEHEKRSGAAYDEAIAKFEAAWQDLYEARYPPPISPPSQPSV